MFDLTGKAALVTGASGGIGGAIARALHQQGAAVTLSGTRAEALEALKAELGERAHVIVAKMDDPLDIERLAKEAEAAMGKIDILVNNAGITRDNLSMRMKDEDWEKVLQVNLTGTFRLIRAAMRGMMRRRHGRVINITSVVGASGNAGQANYAAAKAGINGMTLAMARDLAADAIRVNTILPGNFDTPLITSVPADYKADMRRWNLHPKRFGHPEEYASLALELVRNPYFNAALVRLDGGARL